MKSEVDRYINMVYINLGKIGNFCLDNGRFLKNQTMRDSLNDIEDGYESTEHLASYAIETGSLDKLKVANCLESGFDMIMAKLELEIQYPFKERN